VTVRPDVPTRRIALALGSNLGDRLANLQGAVDALVATPGVDAVVVSDVFETDPVGGPQQPDYLNAVLVADTTLSPRALLERAQVIEAQFGRERSERWGARTLDIDVLAVGDLVVDEPDLVVPHPRAPERAFVLLPWSVADPSAVVPGLGTVAALVTAVDVGGVRRRGDLALTVRARRAGR
jgi:2-amino-4-hydroxy-6-hydroxymethyldihydropteridine diphosphokinase